MFCKADGWMKNSNCLQQCDCHLDSRNTLSSSDTQGPEQSTLAAVHRASPLQEESPSPVRRGEMSEDEQEARSVKYHETYKIARLSSGHLAVFDYDFQLVGITDPLAFPFDIPARFHDPKTHYPAHEYATKSTPKSSARTPQPATPQLLDLL